ncbi:MAG: hypothetical protein EOO71_04585 [Myxococcaceae bacterium]|nr:MAG: hypothetical protein EOO71_04585 [Myxococcaceae bacterium]
MTSRLLPLLLAVGVPMLASAREPKSAQAYVACGQFLRDNGRLDEANAGVTPALELAPRHEEAKALGQLLRVLLTDWVATPAV